MTSKRPRVDDGTNDPPPEKRMCDREVGCCRCSRRASRSSAALDLVDIIAGKAPETVSVPQRGDASSTCGGPSSPASGFGSGGPSAHKRRWRRGFGKAADGASSDAGGGSDWFVALFSRIRKDGSKADRTSIRTTSCFADILCVVGDDRSRFGDGFGVYERRDGAAAHGASSSGTTGADVADAEDEDGEDDDDDDADGEGPGTAIDDRRLSSMWEVVFVMGPLRSPKDADYLYTKWADSKKGLIAKTARGEALAKLLQIPGFVRWDSVFDRRT